jgi:hypothetical protein
MNHFLLFSESYSFAYVMCPECSYPLICVKIPPVAQYTLLVGSFHHYTEFLDTNYSHCSQRTINKPRLPRIASSHFVILSTLIISSVLKNPTYQTWWMEMHNTWTTGDVSEALTNRGVLLSTLLQDILHLSHHLLNVLLQIANKLGLSNKKNY